MMKFDNNKAIDSNKSIARMHDSSTTNFVNARSEYGNKIELIFI